MKIALVHPRFDRSGGAERSALNLAIGLAARGHEVHAFGRRAAGAGGAFAFHRVPGLPAGRTLKTWTFAHSVARMVSRARFDIVQGFGRTTCETVHRASGGIHRAYLEKVCRSRLTWYDRVRFVLDDRLFASPHLRAIICPSTWVAGEVRRFYPDVSTRIHVIRNGVDLAEFNADDREPDARAVRRAMHIPEQAPVVLFVATEFRRKGLDTAVRALPMLPAAHLVVVGGDREAPYRVLAGTLGVGARLHFAGRQASLAGWYRAADVLVLPTRYDPFANVCLEAAACGTPVVTTDNDGAGEVIRNDTAGVVLTSPVTPGAVAQAVEALLARGPEVRAAARSLARRYALDAHVSAVDRLYVELVARGGER